MVELLMTRNCFVYALTRPNGEPFYIGKGTSRRVADHAREARKGSQTIKCRIIRKIWADGETVGHVVIKNGLSAEDAYALEAELIAYYGRIDIGTGVLANHTDGGDGVRGHSEETKALLRERTKAQMTPEARARLREIAKAQFADAAAREAMADICRAAQSRPDLIEANRLRGIQQTASAEARQRLSAVSRAYNSTPEAKAAQSKIKRAMWLDPARREKMLAAQAAGRARKKQMSTIDAS